jgi:hypothetical protein
MHVFHWHFYWKCLVVLISVGFFFQILTLSCLNPSHHDAKSLNGQSKPLLHQFPSSLLPDYFQSISSLLPVYFQSTFSLLTVYLQSTSSLLPLYFQSTSSLLPVFFQSTSSLLPLFFQSTSSLLPVYFQSTSSQLPVFIQTSAKFQGYIYLSNFWFSMKLLQIDKIYSVVYLW